MFDLHALRLLQEMFAALEEQKEAKKKGNQLAKLKNNRKNRSKDSGPPSAEKVRQHSPQLRTVLSCHRTTLLAGKIILHAFTDML